MDGQGAGLEESRVAAELRRRLDAAAPGRLTDAIRLITRHAFEVMADLRPTPQELEALLQFLTDVGYATDARRQEWVLLADVLGLTDGVTSTHLPDRPGITPATLPGPFYRADAPLVPLGANLCRDGLGQPLEVTGTLRGPAGEAVAGAMVEVWHANAAGRYENQDPDSQPEFNLRGRLLADATGVFHFRTIRPAGYALPDDGPVGTLARQLGLSLDRPAHIHFAITAPGYRQLVTAVFDGSDPAIDRDALFAVRPGMVGSFVPRGRGFALDVALVLDPEPPVPETTDSEG